LKRNKAKGPKPIPVSCANIYCSVSVLHALPYVKFADRASWKHAKQRRSSRHIAHIAHAHVHHYHHYHYVQVQDVHLPIVLLIFIFKLPSETKQSHKTNVQQPILQAKSLRCVVFVGHKQHYALSDNNQQQLQPQSQTSQAQGQLHLHCFCIFNLITTN
jgi:hypothetical protein